MGDIADRAADEESAFINNALQAQNAKFAVAHESLSECVDCEMPIPAARQLAVKGCVTCVGCQYERELLQRQGVL